MGETTCDNCNEILSQEILEQDKPCPNCGSKKKHYHLKAESGSFKLTGYPASINVLRRIVKKYPILTFLYLALDILAFSLGLIIPGILGLLLTIPITYLAQEYWMDRKEEDYKIE